MTNAPMTFEDMSALLSKMSDRMEYIEHLLTRLTEQTVSTYCDQWFSIDELSDYIPGNPKKPTIYGWVSAQKIPYHKKGKHLAFLRSEIDEWLKQGRRLTIQEIGDKAAEFVTIKRKSKKSPEIP